MNISLNDAKFKEKPYGKVIGWVNKHLYQKDVSVEELATAISEGRAFCPGIFKDNTRSRDNFISASFIALDIDKSTIPMEEVTMKFSCTISYPTFSNDNEGKYSYRLLVRLDEELKSIEEYYKYATILSKILKDISGVDVDSTCTQGSRMYFGTNKKVTTKLSDFDYSKQFLTSWWQEHYNTTISCTNDIQRKEDWNGVDIKDGNIYSLLQKGVNDEEIIYAGIQLKYMHIVSSKQMIEWDEKEEVRIEPNRIDVHYKWGADQDNKRHRVKWKIGSDRRNKLFKILSIKKQIKPTIKFDELLYNAISERHFFFDNTDDRLSNEWIISILPTILCSSLHFETRTSFSCNMTLLREEGKSPQKAVAEKKRQMLVEAVMPLYDTSITLKQNVEVMRDSGLKISLRTLRRILDDLGIKRYNKRKDKEEVLTQSTS